MFTRRPSLCRHHPPQPAPEPAARTLHDSSASIVSWTVCFRASLEWLAFLLETLNLARDEVVQGVEIRGVRRSELPGPRQVHVLPAPLLRLLCCMCSRVGHFCNFFIPAPRVFFGVMALSDHKYSF